MKLISREEDSGYIELLLSIEDLVVIKEALKVHRAQELELEVERIIEE